jgi:hypothetical protein
MSLSSALPRPVSRSDVRSTADRGPAAEEDPHRPQQYRLLYWYCCEGCSCSCNVETHLLVGLFYLSMAAGRSVLAARIHGQEYPQESWRYTRGGGPDATVRVSAARAVAAPPSSWLGVPLLFFCFNSNWGVPIRGRRGRFLGQQPQQSRDQLVLC